MTTPSTPPNSPHSDNRFWIEESGTEMAWLLNAEYIVTTGMGGLFSEQPDLSRVHALLDIACGPGGWALDVAREYPEIQVTGIDISEPMIQYARAHAQARSLENVQFRVMDALQPLDFAEGAFDLVNARTLFGFLSPTTWPILLQECRRMLRSGGVLRLTELEAPLTTSAALEQLWELTARASFVTGRSFSPTGRHIGVLPKLGRLLRDAGYQQIQHKAHAIDFSAGTPAFQGWYDNYKVVFKLFEPFLIKTRVTTAEEFERLYEHMVLDMLAEEFCAIKFYLTVWGEKP